MPPKTNFKKEKIMQIAFEILRKEGLGALSARKIAMNLKCSTRPVYTAFSSMTELQDAVIDMALQYAMKYFQQNNDCTGSPFLNMGIQYFRFAREEKELFKLLEPRLRNRSSLLGHMFQTFQTHSKPKFSNPLNLSKSFQTTHVKSFKPFQTCFEPRFANLSNSFRTTHVKPLKPFQTSFKPRVSNQFQTLCKPSQTFRTFSKPFLKPMTPLSHL